MPFYKYRTDHNNTIIAVSGSSFTLGANEAQISSSFVIPSLQSTYLYRVTGGTAIVPNLDSFIIEFLEIVDNIDDSSSVTFRTFTGYTGTTAPATYSTKTNFNTFTGTTVPATYAKLTKFNTFTGTTAPATYSTKTNFNTFTGTTVPATYALKTNFNTFTGTTAPSTYALKTNFNTFTGTTAPATYQPIITFKDDGVTINTGTTKFSTLNFSSGITITNKGSNTAEIKAIYGSETFTTGRTSTQTSTSSTFADYLAKSFTLAGGTYKVEYVCKVTNSTANSNVGTQLLIDGAAMESGTNNLYRIVVANQRVMNSAFIVQVLTAGAHSFRLQFNTSTGTATAEFGQILITRIS